MTERTTDRLERREAMAEFMNIALNSAPGKTELRSAVFGQKDDTENDDDV